MALMNAYIQPLMTQYLNRLSDRVRDQSRLGLRLLVRAVVGLQMQVAQAALLVLQGTAQQADNLFFAQ